MKLTPKQMDKWIAARLELLGDMQDEFAASGGFSKSDISRYKFRKALPRVENVERLAMAFKIDVLTLMIALGAVEPDGIATP